MKGGLLLIPAFFLMALFIGLGSSATQTITINETDYKPSVLYPIVQYGVGSQILANITITNSAGWFYIKRVILEWDNSWVECNLKGYSSNWKKYQCILTITSFMDGPTNVYIKSIDFDGNYSILLGNFPFQGQNYSKIPFDPFIPSTRNCINVAYCSQYKKECHYEYTCKRYMNGECTLYSKKKVCEQTNICLKERTRMVCTNN